MRVLALLTLLIVGASAFGTSRTVVVAEEEDE